MPGDQAAASSTAANGWQMSTNAVRQVKQQIACCKGILPHKFLRLARQKAKASAGSSTQLFRMATMLGIDRSTDRHNAAMCTCGNT